MNTLNRRRLVVHVAPQNRQLVEESLAWLKDHDRARLQRRRDLDQELARPLRPT